MSENGKQLKPSWQWVKFGDVVQLSKERCKDPIAEGYERFVGLEHLEPGDLKIRSWGDTADGITFTSVFKPGQVLFGKRRAYQRKAAVADFSGVCSGDIYVFESKDSESLLPELLPFICQTETFFNHAVGTSAGSLSPRTNWTSLASYEFALPPIDEQERLLEVFDSVDVLIEEQTHLKATAKKLLNSLREDIFSSEKAELYKLFNLLDTIQAGKSLVGINEPPETSEQYAVLKVSAVGASEFKPEESKVLIDQNTFMSQHAVKEDDVLITRANTTELVGMVCLVDKNYPNLMLSDKTLRLIPKAGIEPYLLVEALKSNNARTYLMSNATGTGGAMKNISQEKLKNMDLYFPDEESRKGCASLLFEAKAAFHSSSVRLEQLLSLRKQCLHKAFGGV